MFDMANAITISLLISFMMHICYWQDAVLVHALCPDQNGYNSVMVSCYAATNKYECMTSKGFCGTTDNDALVKYANCSSSLGTVMKDLKNLDCVSILSTTDSSGLSSAAKTTKATEYCNLTYPGFIAKMCSPIGECPNDDEDLLLLTQLAGCLLPTGLTDQQLASYNPYGCLQEQEGTTGVPSVCKKDNPLYLFTSCGKDTYQVINDILKLNSTSTESCDSLLKGPVLNPYCKQDFGEALLSFCSPPLCNQQTAGLPTCTFIGIVAGVGGFFVITLAGVCICIFIRRRRRSRDDMYIKSPTSASSANSMSSYKNLVTTTPMMSTTPVIQQELPHFGSARDISELPRLNGEDTEVRHRRELIEFYMFHDPDRSDIESHVDK